MGGVKKVEGWILLIRTPESMMRMLAVDLVSADAEKGGARIWIGDMMRMKRTRVCYQLRSWNLSSQGI